MIWPDDWHRVVRDDLAAELEECFERDIVAHFVARIGDIAPLRPGEVVAVLNERQAQHLFRAATPAALLAYRDGGAKRARRVMRLNWCRP